MGYEYYISLKGCGSISILPHEVFKVSVRLGVMRVYGGVNGKGEATKISQAYHVDDVGGIRPCLYNCFFRQILGLLFR